MYIELSVLFDIFVGTLGAVLLVLGILCLIKFLKILTKVDSILGDNKENIDTTLKNTKDITDNVKDISDAATEATAEAIVMKDNLTGHIDTIKDILSIIVSTFSKK